MPSEGCITLALALVVTGTANAAPLPVFSPVLVSTWPDSLVVTP